MISYVGKIASTLGCAHAGISVLFNRERRSPCGARNRWDGPDDDEALKEARQLVNGRDIEVWQGPRIVAYLTPDDR